MSLVDLLLRRPLHVVEAKRLHPIPHRVTPSTVVDSPRLLLLVDGRIRYEVEGEAFMVQAGDVLFVPARVYRQWRRASEDCDLLFFSFDSDPPVYMDPMPMVARDINPALERAAIERVIAAHHAGRKTEAEGEMKAILARVLTRATPVLNEHKTRVVPSFGVRAALQWMEANFARPDVLVNLHERAGLSAWYFRKRFKQATGRRPSEHLMHLRMRAARLYVMESGLSMKQVARRVGFADPLYFSRCYSRFWGRPPSACRKPD